MTSTLIPLIAFVHEKGQDETAKILGSSQPAICKALKTRRAIFVSADHHGGFSSFEIKGFPAGGSRQRTSVDLEQIVKQLVRLTQSANPSVHSSSLKPDSAVAPPEALAS